MNIKVRAITNEFLQEFSAWEIYKSINMRRLKKRNSELHKIVNDIIEYYLSEGRIPLKQKKILLSCAGKQRLQKKRSFIVRAGEKVSILENGLELHKVDTLKNALLFLHKYKKSTEFFDIKIEGTKYKGGFLFKDIK